MLGLSIANQNQVQLGKVIRVAEDRPRVSGKDLYTGTVRYVDPLNTTGVASNSNTGLNILLPKLTATSAYSASADGDIIQLISTWDIKNEAGGYWLANTSGKGVLIRGAYNNPTAITVTYTGSSTWIIRMRDTNKLQFQSLTFSHNYTKELVYVECDSPTANVTKWLKFKDCIFDFQNSSVAIPALIRPVGVTTTGTGDIFFECENCTLTSTKTSGWKWFGNTGLPATATYLIKNCNFGSNGFASFTSGDDNKAKYCLYDNIFNQNAGGTVLSFSSDTSAPTNLGQIVDLRNNTIYVGEGFDPHGVLLGRGTDNVYCVNNTIVIPSTSSSLAIGLVIKTRSSNIGDSYIGGNYIIAPRPFYIKGGSKVTAEYNSCISNYYTRSAFDIDNPVEADMLTGINSTLNVVRYNNFCGQLYAISVLTTSATEKVATSMQGWTMDNNRYYSLNNYYIYNNQNSTLYLLANRSGFWISTQDINSKMLPSNFIQNV